MLDHLCKMRIFKYMYMYMYYGMSVQQNNKSNQMRCYKGHVTRIKSRVRSI